VCVKNCKLEKSCSQKFSVLTKLNDTVHENFLSYSVTTYFHWKILGINGLHHLCWVQYLLKLLKTKTFTVEEIFVIYGICQCVCVHVCVCVCMCVIGNTIMDYWWFHMQDLQQRMKELLETEESKQQGDAITIANQ